MKQNDQVTNMLFMSMMEDIRIQINQELTAYSEYQEAERKSSEYSDKLRKCLTESQWKLFVEYDDIENWIIAENEEMMYKRGFQDCLRWLRFFGIDKVLAKTDLEDMEKKHIASNSGVA